MKSGMTFFFQHPDFLDEVEAPVGVSDQEVYRRDLQMVEKAEMLGYDSLWAVEHHFTGYTMSPDVTQVLAYIAAKTKKITIGSAAIILPWHNPVRVVDSVALLDNLSNGRFILGLGRGLGRVEFEGFGIPMDESRERFIEAAQIVLQGLENGYVEFDGKYYQQPKRWIRPQPTRGFKGRAYSAAVSPESQEIMAKLGVGILISPQKAWDKTIAEQKRYTELFETINGYEAPKPIVTCQVFCDEDPVRAKEMGIKYIGNYYRMVMKHYELAGNHLQGMKGYEYYGKVSSAIGKFGDEEAAAHYAEVQVYGTPAQCLEKVAAMRDMLSCDHFNAIFNFGGMDEAESLRNMKLWTEQVLPKIQSMGTEQRAEAA